MKVNIKTFLWQHLLLIGTLYIMTLGLTLCVRSRLGSSVISVLPYVFTSAGAQGIHHILALTIGNYTIIMNALLVLFQIAVLRKQFEPVQLFQLLVGFIFGYLIDANMWITLWLSPDAIWAKVLTQFVGCTVLGLGIALEVRCGSVTMPGEGAPAAISKVFGMEFSKAKIIVDCTLVSLGILFCYLLFGSWQWHIIGIGTLFAMIYVGTVVRLLSKHLAWFDKLLQCSPGFTRYIYGLAKFIRSGR